MSSKLNRLDLTYIDTDLDKGDFHNLAELMISFLALKLSLLNKLNS